MSKLSLGVEKAAVKDVLASPPILPTARAHLTDVSLELPADVAYDEWAQLGRALDRMEHAVQWWRGDWWAFGGVHGWGQRLTLVGEKGHRNYENAAVVCRAFRESSRRRELLTFSHHAEVASMPPGEQDYWLDRAVDEKWDRNTLRREIRRARQVSRATALLPEGVYNVILADPPWQYEFSETDSRDLDTNQYPTLPLEAICDYHDDAGRSIAEVLAPDAVLFLWATSPKLEEAMRVMDAWGFEYRTNAVWVKDKDGMGYWLRQRHELLLIGRRGEFPPPPEHLRNSSVIHAARRAHSEKPDEVYLIVEAMYPTGRWLECFARRGREGWSAFGNEPTGG